MRGTYTIIVANQKVQFTLELERNITVIRGESGTGKTTLIGLLQSYETYGSQSGVTVQCSKPCRVLSGMDWQLRLEHIRNSIVFVDEGNDFLKSADFARAVQGSDNYFVLVTRESLYQLPYSVHSVLELRKTASRNKRTYNRAYPYYDTIDHVEAALKHAAYLVAEDAKAGYQMFAQIAARFGSSCVSADGKSNLFDRASSLLGNTMMIVADGAAFGAEMDKLSKLLEQTPNQITLYLPESFEWLFLIYASCLNTSYL
jgi:hypothetical protein